MPLRIDHALLEAAEGVFKAVGAAIQDLQLFTDSHPRYAAARQRIAVQMTALFEHDSSGNNLTFTLRRKQVEFRRIPLVRVGQHGERVVDALQAMDSAGLQLNSKADAEDLDELLGHLVDALRHQPRGEKKSHRFRFLSPKVVEDMYLVSSDPNDFLGGTLGDEDLTLFVPELQVSRSSFESVISTYKTLRDQFTDGSGLDYTLLRSAADKTVESFASNPPTLVPPMSKSYLDDFTFHHSVNVCLLTVHVARRLVEDQHELQRIALAALLHDLGKSRVPMEILHKPGPLTSAEREILERHPIYGATLIYDVDDPDPLAIQVAFGHHITEVGGYPQTIVDFACDWVTQLVGVLDVFEALTAVRPYKPAMSTQRAFQIMLSMDGMKQRLGFVKLLFNLIGPYPVGSLVELTSGEWAVVSRNDPRRPYAPEVKVVADAKRNRVSESVVVDLASPDDEKLAIAQPVVFGEAIDDLLAGDSIPEPEFIFGARILEEDTFLQREG